MTNHEYWKRRMMRDHQRRFEDYDAFRSRLKEAFKGANATFQQKIDYYLGRIALNEKVSINEALRMLNADELSGMHADVKQYIEWASSNEMTPELERLIENASDLWHISHFQALLKEIDMVTSRLWVETGHDMRDFLGREYRENYYRLTKDLQDFSGRYKSIMGISAQNLKDVIEAPWAPDGKDFSSRIWDNRGRVASSLQRELAKIVTGQQGVGDGAKNMAIQFDVSLGHAERLVHSELGHALDTGQIKAFREQGVEEYEFLATLDTKTTPFCREQDGRHFSLSEYQPGVTAPPHGPWCRSTIIPWFSDDNGEVRAARDPETGNTVLVDAKLNYNDWRKKYVVELMSGAVSGAITDLNSKRALEAAIKDYGRIRKMKTDVKKISMNTGYSEDQIERIKHFIFLDTHDLDGKQRLFDPDFAMAQSWLRLMDGKAEPHDLTMLKHEILEEELMDSGLTQDEAHIEASKRYNYRQEMEAYYASLEERQKRKRDD